VAIAYNAGMELIDTHCHLDVEEFDSDRDASIARCRKAGVSRLLIPAIDAEHWERVVSLCSSQRGLYAALGMHPVFMSQHRQEHLAALQAAIRKFSPLAVGEIGLDYFIPDADRQAQQELFAAQLKIAAEHGLPVILHVRKAHDDVIRLLEQHPVRGGFVHAFNGSLQQAARYRTMNFKFGFGGMLTFERSSKLRALASALPLDDIVLETDAPDMTVASHRGERNSPEYLPEVLQALAQVRAQSSELLAQQTTANACQVLGLD
jgi:TatD DNase family protein